MTVKVKYFGAIEEETGVSEEIIHLENFGNDLVELKAFCISKYNSIKDLSFQLAINQTLAESGTLKDGDEVAFLPPFAGG